MALDLSGLSDADLDAVSRGDMKSVSDAGLSIISPTPKGAVATFIDKVGQHIGVPGTDLDLDHAAKAMTRMLGGDAGTDQQDAASQAAHPIAAGAGSITGATIGLGALGAAVGVATKGAQAAWNARKLEILQEQAAKINAAQDAAHIAQVSEAVNAGSGEAAMARANRVLKEDYINERAAQRTPPSQVAGEEGGPQWYQPGSLPKPPKDMTPADLVALDKSARDTAVKMAKQPAIVALLTGKGTAANITRAAVGASSITGAGFGIYHTYRTLQWLSRLLSD